MDLGSIIRALLAFTLELLELLAITICPAMLALAGLRAFGRVKALITDAAKTLVLSLADAFLVEMLAVNTVHLNFSMCSVRLFS